MNVPCSAYSTAGKGQPFSVDPLVRGVLWSASNYRDSLEDANLSQMGDDFLAGSFPSRGQGLFPGHHADGVASFKFYEYSGHSSMAGVARFMVCPPAVVEVVCHQTDEGVHGV